MVMKRLRLPTECGCCIYWSRDEDHQPKSFGVGWCNRYPPVFHESADPLNSARPQTYEFEWCGEWNAKTAASASFLPSPDQPKATLESPLRDHGFSGRLLNIFTRKRIYTFGDLVKRSPEELRSFLWFGEYSLKQTEEILARFGWKLAAKPSKEPQLTDRP